MNLNKIVLAVRRIALPAVALAGGLVTSAHAAMDTAAVTAALTDAGSAVAVVGAAVLVVYVGMKAFKLVRGAL